MQIINLKKRFWKNVKKTPTCWLWVGRKRKIVRPFQIRWDKAVV